MRSRFLVVKREAALHPLMTFIIYLFASSLNQRNMQVIKNIIISEGMDDMYYFQVPKKEC